ncbi:FecR family protein [Colwellia sp. 20A7]|uniref:FecR family protein n=1 Tax=Colwellia sp. 20A7 TaxID=2689569 RepID=UPI00135C64E0|nr:FecR domain-containing protein [Colwellia sp. 20A7]
MSNVSQFHTKEDIQAQACLWISRMDRGLSLFEQQELVVWCEQNTAHLNALLDMASYWDDVSVLNELSDLFPLDKLKTIRHHFSAIVLAASVAIVSILSVNAFIDKSFLPFIPSLNEQSLTQTQILKTNVGEQNSFTMNDGTHIQLNTNTIVHVSYTPSSRQLTLMQGEARFDIAKDKSRPFTVTSGDKSFTALGTIFNVQKNGHSDIELMVTEGRVLITKATETLEVIKHTLLTTDENTNKTELPGILVNSGEKATITKQSEMPIEQVSLDQIQRDLAWQQGMLIFNGEPLSNALTEVSRYTETHFKITDPKIANIKVSGYFKANDVEGLLASLKSNFNISYSKTANSTILLALNE